MTLFQKKWLSNVKRLRELGPTRLDKLRLDKNEWIGPIPSYLFKKICQQIKPEHITAYPEKQYFMMQLPNIMYAIRMKLL